MLLGNNRGVGTEMGSWMNMDVDMDNLYSSKSSLL